VLLNRDQLILQAQSAAELQRRRFLGEEGIGAALNDTTVLIIGRYLAPKAASSFQDRILHVQPALLRFPLQGVRSREPSDAAADNSNVKAHAAPCCRYCWLCSWTYVTSAAISSGLV